MSDDQTYPDDPAEALVHDLANMLNLHRRGRATAEDVASAARAILHNYDLQTAARDQQQPTPTDDPAMDT